MTISVVKHTDSGAPTLNAVAGSLIAVLDYCLPLQGWSKVFSGTNKAVYRAPTGNRFYLRVDDTQGQYGRLVGYESMTDVDTGTGPFPTDLQISGGTALYKSTATVGGTESRPWVCVATPRGFLLWTQAQNTTDSAANAISYGSASYFGDIKTYRGGDQYGSVLFGWYGVAGLSQTSFAYSSTTQAGKYVARAWHALGGSAQVGTIGDVLNGALSSWMGNASAIAFPNPADRGVYFAPMRILETGPALRGVLPGVWHSLQSYTNFTHSTEIQGSGALAGKTFLMLGMYSSAMLAFEVSDTWEY